MNPEGDPNDSDNEEDDQEEDCPNPQDAMRLPVESLPE